MRHRQSIPPTSPAWDFCEKQLRSSVLYLASFITSTAGRPRKVGKVSIFVLSWAGSFYSCGSAVGRATAILQRKGYIPRSVLLTGKTELTTPLLFFFLQELLFSSVFFTEVFSSNFCCLFPSLNSLLSDLEMSIDESWDKSFRGFFYVSMIKKHCLNNFCHSENKHNEVASSNMKKCA